jgi:hypothetical protein
MKKAILIIPIFLIGCATVKKTNTETELKTDSSASVNIDATKFSEGFTLEPINLEKPILIGGKEHFNTRVIYNNSKETIKYRDTTQVKSDLKQEVKTKDKDYSIVIESVANKLFWLLIIMFVIVMILNYLKRKASII